MSDKKSKSKSKQKEKGDKAQKPPKDAKSKKSKEQKAEKGDGDAKSKKSVDKASKKPSKKGDAGQKPLQKDDLDLSQENFSDFLKNPFGFAAQSVLTDDALCIHHKEINTVFCEVCEQTACESCLLYGPHNNQMHKILKIDQAFQSRYLYLNEIVCNDLIQKREKLTKYLQQLTLLSDELRYVKNGIQKTTKLQYNQMMERLRVCAGGKFAVLHHEMAQLQKDLQSINSLGNQFFELTNINPINANTPQQMPNKGIVPFLLRSKYLQEEAENLISKPIKTSVEVYPYDLPRQLTERKMILDKNRNWIELLKIKDQSIWSLTQQKKNMRGKLIENFNEEAKGEIDQWMKLKYKIQSQLQPLQMKCEKCSTSLNETTVNQLCPKGQFHFFKH